MEINSKSKLVFSRPDVTKGLGVGDLIEKITHAIGIKPCNGCKKRKGYFNRFTLIRSKQK